MNINIKECLYHGISGYNISDEIENKSLYLLERILKSGKLLSLSELCCDKSFKNLCNIYQDLGFYPVVKRSLGFYPTNQEIFELSKKGYETCLNEPIIKYIFKENSIDIDLDEYLMNHGLIGDFAWMRYYSDITLIFDKKLLDELQISWGSMVDEVAIDESVSLKRYLKAVAIRPFCYCEQEGKKEFEYYSQDVEKVKKIYVLLKKYHYDIPIIDFPYGDNALDKSDAKVRVRKMK